MRKINSPHFTKVWISARETYDWAHGFPVRGFTRSGLRWPCSTLSGRRIFAEFDALGNLIELSVDGKSFDADAQEFDALIESAIGDAHPKADIL